jgi:hypothetical protein
MHSCTSPTKQLSSLNTCAGCRAFLQWTRHLDEAFYDNLVCILVAYILGLLLVDSVDYQTLPVTHLTTNLAFALMCASGSLRVFSRHRAMFAREAWTGAPSRSLEGVSFESHWRPFLHGSSNCVLPLSLLILARVPQVCGLCLTCWATSLSTQ